MSVTIGYDDNEYYINSSGNRTVIKKDLAAGILQLVIAGVAPKSRDYSELTNPRKLFKALEFESLLAGSDDDSDDEEEPPKKKAPVRRRKAVPKKKKPEPEPEPESDDDSDGDDSDSDDDSNDSDDSDDE